MADKRNDGGPAFPTTKKVGLEPYTREEVVPLSGMALRDYFAGQALAGFMQHNGWVGYFDDKKHRESLLTNFTRDAYAVADAMLKAEGAVAMDKQPFSIGMSAHLFGRPKVTVSSDRNVCWLNDGLSGNTIYFPHDTAALRTLAADLLAAADVMDAAKANAEQPA